jgi:hypothetical protein
LTFKRFEKASIDVVAKNLILPDYLPCGQSPVVGAGFSASPCICDAGKGNDRALTLAMQA